MSISPVCLTPLATQRILPYYTLSSTMHRAEREQTPHTAYRPLSNTTARHMLAGRLSYEVRLDVTRARSPGHAR